MARPRPAMDRLEGSVKDREGEVEVDADKERVQPATLSLAMATLQTIINEERFSELRIIIPQQGLQVRDGECNSWLSCVPKRKSERSHELWPKCKKKKDPSVLSDEPHRQEILASDTSSDETRKENRPMTFCVFVVVRSLSCADPWALRSVDCEHV